MVVIKYTRSENNFKMTVDVFLIIRKFLIFALNFLQEATRNTGASLEREYLTICDTPTPDEDKTSSLKSRKPNFQDKITNFD